MSSPVNTTTKQRTFAGEVISAPHNKTIVVRIDTMKMHSKYQKRYRVSKKYHVHDEKNVSNIGDKVRFVECRPISKTKRWRLITILSK